MPTPENPLALGPVPVASTTAPGVAAPAGPPLMTDAFKTAMTDLRAQYEKPGAETQGNNGGLTPQMIKQVGAMAQEPWLRQQQWAMYGQPNANIGSNMAGPVPSDYLPLGFNVFGDRNLVPGWAETGTPWEQTLRDMGQRQAKIQARNK